jgi:hypothetical protein
MRTPYRRFFPVLTCVWVALAGGAILHGAIQTTLFVSPSGSDKSDGKSIATAFATIARARDAVRPLCGAMTGDIAVEFTKGDYPVSETIAFTQQDSGTNGFHVVYQSHDGIGAAHLIGGFRVSGWTQYFGNIYRAKLARGLTFTTLYENGIRADLARWPKRTSPFATSRGGYMTYIDKKGENLSVLDSAISPDGTSFDIAGKDLSNGWVYAWNGGDGHRWSSVTTAITSASDSNIGIKGCGLGWPPDSFLVEGIRQFLSQPGEYYYDRTEGVLYYMSRFPGSIEGQKIIAPQVVQLISIAGASAESPSHDIRFEGLAFTGTDRIAQSHTDDWADTDPASYEAALYIKNAANIVIRDCKIADTGINGITFDTGTQSCIVRDCLVEHTGYDGVNIKDGSSHSISDCIIRYNGELRGHGSGVSVMNGSHTLSHLEIYYVPRSGIAIRGKGDLIEYVKLHDCVQDSGDQGAIYLVDPASDARCNQITSFHNYVDLSCMDRPPTAVYNDRDAINTVWSNIDAGDSQFYVFRHDPQKTGTLTFDNVSWDPRCNPRANEIAKPLNPSFDRSKMQYNLIGIESDFPSEFNDLKARPDPPINLWSQSGVNSATLHWTEVDRATSYIIERASVRGGPYRAVGMSQVPTSGWDLGTTFEDTGLRNDAGYYYVVKAKNQAGESGPSVEVAAKPSRLGARRLTGSVIGVGKNLAAAFDGDLKTCFESSDGWVGLDLGEGSVITEIRYAPRADNTDTTSKLCGGQFQGANDPEFAAPVTLFEVRATKGGAVTHVLIPAAIFNPSPFRYVRYIGPNGREALIAEMQIYGHTVR